MMKIVVLALLSACAFADTSPTAPQQIVISGYSGTAMEPFLSRDGQFLLFNNSNAPDSNTDLFYAKRQSDLQFVYVGAITGVNTAALEGTPTMDRNNKLYFVSTRSYDATACTIHVAQFNQGAASDVKIVDSICRGKPGEVNFDVDIDPAGTLLTFVDSLFGSNRQPLTADLVMAQWDGTRFNRLPESATLLAAVNTPALEYAPALSSDHLTLWFTRLESISAQSAPQIWRAQRQTPNTAFKTPVRVAGIGDFVEAPALSADEQWLYFHRSVGSGYRIFAIPVNAVN